MDQKRLPNYVLRWKLTFKIHFVLGSLFLPIVLGQGQIGLDYGLNGDNLLSPKQTVALLESKGVKRVRLYETRKDVVEAFVGSGIELFLGIPNEAIEEISSDVTSALTWVTQNVQPYYGQANIGAIIVGNEWLMDGTNDATLLLPAMVNIYTSLKVLSLLGGANIKVSTSHAMSVLGKSYPPSEGQFTTSLTTVLGDLLGFLIQIDSFFMVNIFPYFAYVNDPNVDLGFALFSPSAKPVRDPNTNLTYTNIFDMQLDAVYAALDRVSGSSSVRVDINSLHKRNSNHRVVVGETGWPSGPGPSGSSSTPMSQSELSTSLTRRRRGAFNQQLYTCSGRECAAQSVANAQTYNQNLIRHVAQSRGTPAHPTNPIEAFVFEVFDEDLKPAGPEQHYGLFHPDGTPVYPISFH